MAHSDKGREFYFYDSDQPGGHYSGLAGGSSLKHPTQQQFAPCAEAGGAFPSVQQKTRGSCTAPLMLGGNGSLVASRLATLATAVDMAAASSSRTTRMEELQQHIDQQERQHIKIKLLNRSMNGAGLSSYENGGLSGLGHQRSSTTMAALNSLHRTRLLDPTTLMAMRAIMVPNISEPQQHFGALDSMLPASQYSQQQERQHHNTPLLSSINRFILDHNRSTSLYPRPMQCSQQHLQQHPTYMQHIVGTNMASHCDPFGHLLNHQTRNDPNSSISSARTPSSSIPTISQHQQDASAAAMRITEQRRLRGCETFPMILQRTLAELDFSAGGAGIAGFLPNGKSFQVWNQHRFEGEILPIFFPRMKSFASFQRQLNLYNFQRVNGGSRSFDRGSYHHALFLRDFPALSEQMKRTKTKGIKVSKSGEK
jgi:hypothetical protein